MCRPEKTIRAPHWGRVRRVWGVCDAAFPADGSQQRACVCRRTVSRHRGPLLRAMNWYRGTARALLTMSPGGGFNGKRPSFTRFSARDLRRRKVLGFVCSTSNGFSVRLTFRTSLDTRWITRYGRGGFEHLVLGSVTVKVVRQARCPVLTVPPPAARSTLPFKRVLCPVDFSEASILALECAFSIAQESDARLTLLHVFDWPSNHELSLEGAFDVPAFQRQREEEARHRLAALIPEDARNWCAPEPTLRHGKPYREILAVAESEHADLVVMGVHGRNALDVMLFGSNTNQVVRRASCPVLTLRK